MKTIHHRLILPIQAKGNVGKSTEAIARACWLEEHHIDWQGFDLDQDNRSLSRMFPESVQLVPITGRPEDQDTPTRMLAQVPSKPVTLVDPRAHLDTQLIDTFQATDFFNVSANLGIGITLMVFPFDDLNVMTNIDEICQACGKNVDYIIVRNPAKALRTDMFDNSQLQQDLEALGASYLEIPVMGEFVKMNLADLEVQHGRPILFSEAVSDDSLKLNVLVRGLLQHWLGHLYAQYDQLAAKLLPTELAQGIKGPVMPKMDGKPRVVRGAKLNFSKKEIV